MTSWRRSGPSTVVAALGPGPLPTLGVDRRRRLAAEVMDRLGHSTIVAAVRYQHVMADRDTAIARELDRLIENG
jgi:hypothetical protein